MPHYKVDLAKMVPAPGRRLMFLRRFDLEADDDDSAIEKLKALDILSTEKGVDAVGLFTGDDPPRGVWNQMRKADA
jgi:hypothetical protein